jgi:hypothetical protein
MSDYLRLVSDTAGATLNASARATTMLFDQADIVYQR